MIRLTAARSGATALAALPMPDAWPNPVRCIALPLPVAADDWRLQHKTSDRGFYEAGLAQAQACGATEALLFARSDLRLTEGTRTNLFVRRKDGKLATPPQERGLLPGILRRRLLDSGEAVEEDITLANLAGGFFIGNALRGLLPATLVEA